MIKDICSIEAWTNESFNMAESAWLQCMSSAFYWSNSTYQPFLASNWHFWQMVQMSAKCLLSKTEKAQISAQTQIICTLWSLCVWCVRPLSFFTCYGSGPSCWCSHRMRSHCLNIVWCFYCNPPMRSSAFSPLWNNDITSSASVQYKSSHNPFNVSEKAFLKMAVRISKWQADEL